MQGPPEERIFTEVVSVILSSDALSENVPTIPQTHIRKFVVMPESAAPLDQNAPSLEFEELATSRRQWIDTVLHPWCRTANQKQLMQASLEWLDLAGRVDIDATLWTWAWERFPVLTHPELSGVNETHPVRVRLANGDEFEGFPDSRRSVRGNLVLLGHDETTGLHAEQGPFSIDAILEVTRVNSDT